MITTSLSYKTIITYVCFITILIVGAYLRLNHIFINMYWIDGARDVYVAKHMWETKQFPFIAPWAGAGENSLPNSPLYYYLLTAGWGLTHSPQGIMFLFALANILTLPINFYTGYKLTNSKLGGLILLVLSTFTYLGIQQSRNIFQPHLLPLVLSCLLLALTKKWLSTAVILLFIGIHLHNSVLTIVPAIFLWVLYFAFTYKRPIPAIIILLLSLAWIKTTSITNPNTSILSFFHYQFQDHERIFKLISSTFLGYLFPLVSNTMMQLFIYVLLIIGMIYLRRFLLAGLLLCAIPLCFVQFPAKMATYYQPFYLITLAAISFLIFHVIRLHKVYGSIAGSILLVMVLILLNPLYPQYLNYIQGDTSSYYQFTHAVSTQLIGYHHKKYGNRPAYITSYSYTGDINTALGAYQLFFDHQLPNSVRLVPTYESVYNIIQDHNQDEIEYLICDSYPPLRKEKYILDECLDKFSTLSQITLPNYHKVINTTSYGYQAIVLERLSYADEKN